MCGIVGLITKHSNGFTYQQQKMVYQMLVADEVRGADATGVITVHNNKDFGLMKEATEGYYFVDSFIDSDLDKDLYRNSMAVIGHNRAKTVGDNKDENAHPFSVDNTFAMVHNGTLRNHHELSKTEVDSEALAIELKQAMDKEDWKLGLEEALGRVRGAYACVWYDQKRHQLCMIRNSERPLGFIQTPHSILFGSELGMLGWIANRNGEDVKEWKSLEIHKLYTFDMEEGKGAYQETFLSLKYPTPVTKGFTNGTHSTRTRSTGKQVKTSHSNDAGGDDIQDAPFRPYDDPVGDNGALSKNAFKRLKGLINGKEIEFLCDDYVEANHGTFLAMGRCTNGSFDLCEVRHSVSAVIATKETGVREEDFWAGGVVFKGIIDEVDYDKDNQAASITLKGVTLKEFVNAIH